MRTEYLAWGILGPDGLCGLTSETRIQAIRLFCTYVDVDCYDQTPPDDLFWFWRKWALSPVEKRTWRRYKRQGFSAVPVAVTIY